jgi:hypothetical protein
MYGDLREPGIMILAAAELLSQSMGQLVRVSMVELHNETLSDLLAPPAKAHPAQGQSPPPLEVRGGSGGTMANIVGAKEVVGGSVASLLGPIKAGLARRQTAATVVNATSSRSHLVVVFRIGQQGVLTLVDLAGVERVKRSKVEGKSLQEAQSINRTLHSLSDVVDALRRGERHVPVRNSRIARLISGALGGGAETAVVVCLSPSAASVDETVSALCFADRVRRIPAPTRKTTPGHDH